MKNKISELVFNYDNMEKVDLGADPKISKIAGFIYYDEEKK
jgi:hypothetical protein